MNLRELAVIGAGLMGHGIVQLAAQNVGCRVHMIDVEQKFLDNGLSMIRSSLERMANKNELRQNEISEIMDRINATTDLPEAISRADFIIEAVPENEKLKVETFKKVDQYASPSAYITSNTSSMSITFLASVTSRPEKVCGMHFFNPPQLMKLVEIIRGAKTSDETIQATADLAKSMGKESVIVKKDTPGFIVNRILIPALNEAAFLIDEGIADAADVDKAIKLGLNWPMGPLALLDYIGLDTCLAVSEVLTAETGDQKFRPSQLLKRMVRSRQLGRKTGQGFYNWAKS